jgi:hypothetical protein
MDQITEFIPIALAAGALVQIAKETGRVRQSWLLRAISVLAGGVMGFVANKDVIGGMAAGGMATAIFAATTVRIQKGE